MHPCPFINVWKYCQADLLEPKVITLMQQIVGTLLYYAMAVNLTMLVALGNLSSNQRRITSKTWENIVWLLNYAHTHPNAVVRYAASNMWLPSTPTHPTSPSPALAAKQAAISFSAPGGVTPTKLLPLHLPSMAPSILSARS
jgi:hypothetical protein